MFDSLKRLFRGSTGASGSRSPRPVEQRRERLIRFVGEQDGEPERSLKSTLLPLFAARPAVRNAYLARVACGPTSEAGVALCIAGPEDATLVAELATAFARQFAEGVPLDILFLSGPRELELQRVCRPFYGAG